MRTDSFSVDNCLKCSLCNTMCPVMGVEPEYPGPKRLGPELERMRVEGVATDTAWVEYCLGCHRCDLACPNQVDVSAMIAAAKATHRKPLQRRLRDWWFARPALLARLAFVAPAVFNLSLSLKPVRVLMERVMGISSRRPFPRYTHGLRPRSAAQAPRGRVAFFPGCYFRANRPDLAAKVVHLLEHCGYAVEIPATTCCGVPSLANGAAAEAAAQARTNLERLAPLAESGVPILTACSSCGHMLKTGFSGLLEGDLSARANLLASATWDLGEFLAREAADGRFAGAALPGKHRVAYHAPCHLKSQGIGQPWVALLRQIDGVSVEPLDAGCCGMSGTYGFKQEKYRLSMRIGQSLFERIEETRAESVASECATCRMQIEHGTGTRTLHPLELLEESIAEEPHA